MTRTTRALCLVLCLAASRSARTAVAVKHDAGPTCTKTDITFWWRLEGTTFVTNSDYTAGADSTATLTGCTIDILSDENTDATKMDTLGMWCIGSAAAATFDLASNLVVPWTKGRAAFWWKYTGTGPTGGARIWRSSDGTGRVDVRTHGMCVGGTAPANTVCTTTTPCTGGGTCGNGVWLSATHKGTGTAVQIDGTSAQLSADTWYFVELAWDQTLGSGLDRLQLWVDHVAVTGSTAATDLNTTATTFSTLYVGTEGTSSSPFNYFSSNNFFDGVWISSNPDKDLWSCRNTTDYPE